MKLVLLPGLDGTGRLFSPFLNVIPPDYSALIIDYPANETLSYAELLKFVQQRLPVDEPYVVIAESFSGPIAIRSAACHPPSLRALILCATFVSNPAPLSLDLGFLLWDWEFSINPPEFLIKKFLLGPDPPASLLESFRKALREVAPTVLSFRTRSLFGVDVREDFRRCQVPILYLVAKEDKLLRRSSLDEMREMRPDMEVEEIDGPHLLLQRNPRECLEAMGQFLSSAISSP